MSKARTNLTLTDVRLVFRNFSGRKEKFNPPGARNFTIALTPEQTEQCKLSGFRPKYRPANDEYEESNLLKVRLNYQSKRPPVVVRIGSLTKKRTTLTEDSVGSLDFSRFNRVDVELNPYEWCDDNEVCYLSAYLTRMYVTVEETPLDLLYEDEKFEDDPPFDV